MKRRSWPGRLARMVLVWGLLAPAAAGAVPDQLAHEGVATDGDGVPLTDLHDVRVRLYTQAAGGVARFDELHQGVAFFDGYYALQIGAVEVLAPALFTEAQLFVGLSIDGGPELAPRLPLGVVPEALAAAVADRAVGALTPTQVSIGAAPVINNQGEWVGAVDGLRGPAGPAGVPGVAGPQGPQGAAGLPGGSGSPDTPAQVLAKLLQADGPGSGLDADRLDGIDSGAFVRTGAQAIGQAVQADGAGSGLDADTLDGLDSTDLLRTAADFLIRIASVDGTGSGIDMDLFHGHDSTEFARTPAELLALIVAAGGHNSGIDADMIDGLHAAQFGRTNRDMAHTANLRAQGDVSVGLPSALKLAGRNGPPGDCNLGRIGQVYYDSTIGRIAGCNGVDWAILGGRDSGSSVVSSPVLAWGGNFAEANFEPTVWRDVPGHSVQFTKRDADSVMRVVAAFSGGYAITCHGSTVAWRMAVDGVPTGPFQAHGGTRNGWWMDPWQLTFFVKSLGVGTHTAQLQVIRHGCSNDVRTGWPNGSEDHITAEEVPEGRIALRQQMVDTRHTPNDWSNLPERSVVYTKKEAGTVLDVVLADTLGYLTGASGGDACAWRLTMDGALVDGGRGLQGYNGNHTGWRINPRTWVWRMDGVAPGAHTFQVQVKRINTATTSECLAGWAGPTNTFAVVEQAVGNTAIRRHMVDTRHTPNSFSNLPEREVVHTKQNAGTRVRISYQDTLGYHQLAGSWGCRWRLTVDDVNKGRMYGSHTNNGGAWRINGHRLQWIIPGLPVGAHTYRIQVDRPNAASTNECLAGHINGSISNYLLIEEIE